MHPMTVSAFPMANAQTVMGGVGSGVHPDGGQVTGTAGERRFVADYVIGADGGRSTVRKLLGIEFEGYTWPERFLVVTTKFDFGAALGCCNRNYMADPEEWTNLSRSPATTSRGAGARSSTPVPMKRTRKRCPMRRCARALGASTSPMRKGTISISTCTTCTSAWPRASARGRRCAQ